MRQLTGSFTGPKSSVLLTYDPVHICLLGRSGYRANTPLGTRTSPEASGNRFTICRVLKYHSSNSRPLRALSIAERHSRIVGYGSSILTTSRSPKRRRIAFTASSLVISLFLYKRRYHP